jgi:hypothetical protein
MPHLARVSLSMITLAALSFTGCGGGGSGGGGNAGSPPPSPAYVNGTITGQFGLNDLGFYAGALTSPATPTSTTVNPKLLFDIGNGFPSPVLGGTVTVTNVTWRVLKNGTVFSTGVVASIDGLGWTNIELPITPGAGTAVYRIEIDYTNAFSEANENNNFVEYTVAIPASG